MTYHNNKTGESPKVVIYNTSKQNLRVLHNNDQRQKHEAVLKRRLFFLGNKAIHPQCTGS